MMQNTRNIRNIFVSKNTDKEFNSKELAILEKNKKFFSHDAKYVRTMLKIINGDSEISIRLLDWFVSNYSKKNNTSYTIKINDVKSSFVVHNEYKNQLNGYSKTYFDPFCRKEKIVYYYKDNNKRHRIAFNSSIGQLNFFQWAIRNRIIIYVQNHIEDIDRDMKITAKENKVKKELLLKEQLRLSEVFSNISDESDTNPILMM